MKKLALTTVLAFMLSACSTSTKMSKPVVTKQNLIGTWVCVIKYDDLKMTTLDISEFNANGEMKNVGEITDKTFDPIKFTYQTQDEGRWDLAENQLIIDYDLTKRKVIKTTPKKFLALLKQKKYKDLKLDQYEQALFNILSDTQKAEDSQIKLEILKFDHSRMAIQQKMGDKMYSGGCVTAEKAQEYLDYLQNNKSN